MLRRLVVVPPFVKIGCFVETLEGCAVVVVVEMVSFS